MSGIPPGPPADPQKAPSFALLRLICGHICLHGSMAGLRMAAPLLALRQGHSALSVGVLLALFSLTQVFLALPAGRYADRHGLKRPMGMGVVAASAGAFLAVLSPQFWVLCIAALLMGGATGAASIALQRHVGRAAHDSNELKRVFSWLAIGPAVSNFVGPVLAGLLIDHVGVWMGGTAGDDNGFRGAFVMLALLPWATWLWVRHTRELPPVQPVAGAGPAGMAAAARAAHASAAAGELVAGQLLDVPFVVPVLGHERAFSASVIGTILGAFAIAAAAVRLVMPLLVSHLREWVVVSGAMVATALLFVVYPFMNSPWTMGLCSVLLGLALGSVQPMIMSTLHQITPHHLHGQALGLRLAAINLSSVLMPMLFGTAGMVVGVSVVFWTVGAAGGVGSRLAWRLRP
jgi:MFS family permease